jgi:hypothetical protein
VVVGLESSEPELLHRELPTVAGVEVVPAVLDQVQVVVSKAGTADLE